MVFYTEIERIIRFKYFIYQSSGSIRKPIDDSWYRIYDDYTRSQYYQKKAI